MVKGVSRAPGQTSQAAPQPLPTMQTGQTPNDPLTQLNGHRAFGAMAGFNPFAQMGLNTNDPNMVRAAPPRARVHTTVKGKHRHCKLWPATACPRQNTPMCAHDPNAMQAEQ